MKNKNIKKKISIAFIIAAAFLSAGCESRQFKIERASWKALQLSKKIFNNPDVVSPYELNRAVEAYRKVISDYPDSPEAARRAQMSIGYIYLSKKDYGTARSEFSKLIKDCDEKSDACAEAAFAVGGTFEREGNWEMAEQEYKKIMKDYYLTKKGLEAPIYLINKYRLSGQAAKARRAMENAVAHYRSKKDMFGEKFSYLLQNLIAQCYLIGGDWYNFIKTLDIIIEEFPINKELTARTMLTKAFVYEKQLGDDKSASLIFKEIQDGYPETNAAKALAIYLQRKEKAGGE